MPDASAMETRPSQPARWPVFLLLGLVVAGVAAAIVFRPGPPPPTEDVLGDPFLMKGSELYQMRCVSCHGARGKGDGPIAKSVGPPPPGDLSDGEWKHGGEPEQVLNVIADGVPQTQMAGWRSAFTPRELRAVTGYVFHLAGRSVPESLRAGWEPDDPADP